MIPSYKLPETAGRAIRRTFLPQAVSDLLTARDGRRSTDRFRARPRLEGLEDRCLLSITEYPVPTAGAGPMYIARGPDGNLWFTENNANRVGTINLTTHAVSEFTIPAGKNVNVRPKGITAGPDGNVWFTENSGNQIGMINPATHAISQFAIPTPNSYPWGIAAGPDGNLWFAEENKIGRINPTTHAITEFATSSFAHVITAGPDGNMWFAEPGANKIGEINSTGTISEFPVPTAGAGPYAVTAGPDGNLWFTEVNVNQVGKISPTGTVTEFPVPSSGGSAGLREITAAPDGNLWFSYQNADQQIGSIDPVTDVTNVVSSPYTGSTFDGLTEAPDGNLWVADYGTSAIGVVPLTMDQTPSLHLAITQQPPAGVTAGNGFGLTLQVEDSSNNLVPSFNGTVTVGLASSPGGTTLGGTLTVAASGGVATFSGLTLTKAATGYTLYVSGSGPISTSTSSITVTPAAATQLVILQQPPATVSVNAPFTVQAAIEDQYGNVVTSANNTVTVDLANNPSGATLGGTTTVAAVNGVVTFSNLTLNKRAKGYTLRLSSPGLTGSTSGAITVQ
jgi:streptogramin lyase